MTTDQSCPIRFYVYVSDYDCSHDLVSSAIGLQPHSTQTKGSPILVHRREGVTVTKLKDADGNPRSYETNLWSSSLYLKFEDDLSGKMISFLSRHNFTALEKLNCGAETLLTVVAELTDENSAFEISNEGLRKLSDEKLQLDFDLYWFGTQTSGEAATHIDYWPDLSISMESNNGPVMLAQVGGWQTDIPDAERNFPDLVPLIDQLLAKIERSATPRPLNVEIRAAGIQTPITWLTKEQVTQLAKHNLNLKITCGPRMDDKT